MVEGGRIEVMDYIISELFGYCTDPVDLAVRFLIVILMLEGLFGIVGTVLRPLVSNR